MRFINMQKLNNAHLNIYWVKEDIKMETKSYFKMNEYKNIAYQLLWDVVKAVLTGKFVAIYIYIHTHINQEDLKQPNFTHQESRKRKKLSSMIAEGGKQ